MEYGLKNEETEDGHYKIFSRLKGHERLDRRKYIDWKNAIGELEENSGLRERGRGLEGNEKTKNEANV